MKSALICILYALSIMLVAYWDAAKAQETEYTYCTGPNGEVEIRTDATCKPGWIPS